MKTAFDTDTALDHSLNYIFMPVDTLDLNCMCAGDHQNRRLVERRSHPFSERKKWHVRDYEFYRCAADDRLCVEAHQFRAC